MKLYKFFLLVTGILIISCSNNNDVDLNQTCKTFYEGKKLYLEQKHHDMRPPMNDHRPQFDNQGHRPQFSNKNHKPNQCMQDIKNLCGHPFKVGIKSFSSCMDKKQNKLSKKCLKFHMDKKNKKMKNGNKCLQEIAKICGYPQKDQFKRIVSCIDKNIKSFSNKCQQVHLQKKKQNKSNRR